MENLARRVRRERQRAAVRSEIKAVARAHMARSGAAALSLRQVAAEMGLSSAAIYYYYPNRDALITALIVDAYRALGAALRAVDLEHNQAGLRVRLRAVLLAYRTWAIAHPAEFALIFGAPIPGYHAPADVTAPEARAALQVVTELFASACAQGPLRTDLATNPIPGAVAAHAAAWMRAAGQQVALPALVATLRAWALGHGLVALELNGQLAPIIGDAASLYEHTIQGLLDSFGV